MDDLDSAAAPNEAWQPPLFTVSTWVLIASAVVLLFVYDYWKHQHLARCGFTGPKPFPLFGTTFAFMFHKGGLLSYQQNNIAKFGKIYGSYAGWRPIVVIADADLVKLTCIKDFTSFANRKSQPIDNKPFDKSLSALRDDHWKDVRGILSPTFSGSKMKLMAPIINGCLDPMIRKVTRHHEENKSLQLKEIYGGYLIDAIANTAFGLSLNSQENENDPFLFHAQNIFKIKFNFTLFVLVFVPFLTPLLNWFGASTLDRKDMQFFESMMDQVVELRKNASEKRLDLLQIMLDAQEISDEDRAHATEEEKLEHEHRKKMTKKSLTSSELKSQGLTFFLAGYETSNTTLGFASYLLATHAEIQDKLVAEINTIAPGRDDVTYENISKMTYLDCVICETLRLYPPSTLAGREANNDYTYEGITIPKGTEVLYSIWYIHHDPDHWEEPDKFNPDRFAPGEREKRHPCAWMPFGVGPRICIGMRFALLQVKMGLVRMLQKFRLETCPETEIPPVLGQLVFLTPPNGFKLSAIPRS